jgi:hypothetical protein
MTRTLELRVNVPAIVIRGWTPHEQECATVPFRKEGLTGQISLHLDPEAINDEEWYEDGTVGEASYGRVIVRIEGHCDPEISEEAWLRTAQELTDRHLNRLLLYIMSELQQYWVTTVPISEWSVNLFIARTSPSWIGEEGPTQLERRHAAVIVDLPVMEFYDRRSTLDTAAWERIASWIQAQQSDHTLLAKAAIANAKRSFEGHSYAMAAVHTVTALDLAVPRFFVKRCQRHSISLPSESSVGWSLRLLPLLLPAPELQTWLSQQDSWLRRPARDSSQPLDSMAQTIVARCVKLNGLRNKIVHDAYDPRDDSDIECIKQGILAAEWLVGFIAQASSNSPTT